MKKFCEEKRIEIKIPFKISEPIEDFFRSCNEPIHNLSSKLLIVDFFTWLVSVCSFLLSLWIVVETVELVLEQEITKEAINYINNYLEDKLYLIEELSLISITIALLIVYSVIAKLVDLSNLIFHKIHKISAESLMDNYSNGVVRMVLSSKKPEAGIDDVEACILKSDLLKILKNQKENLEKEGVYLKKILEELEN